MTFDIIIMIVFILVLSALALWPIRWRRERRIETPVDPKPTATKRAGGHGQWNIAPGETRDEDGNRDHVLEASMQSFPASDPPAYY